MFGLSKARSSPTILPLIVATACALSVGAGLLVIFGWRDAGIPVIVWVVGALAAMLAGGSVYFGLKLRESLRSLKDAEEYRGLFDHHNDPVIIFDPVDRRLIDVNETAYKVFGISRPALAERHLDDIFAAAESARVEIAALLSAGTAREFESVQFHSDGSAGSFLVDLSLIEYRGKQAVMSVYHDISERRRAQDGLKKNLAFLTSTFEASADGILAVDLDENIIISNAKFAEMWGFAADDLSGRSGSVIEHMLSLAKDPEELKSRIQHSFRHPAEIVCHRLDLTDGRVFERQTQPQYVDGQVIGRVLNFRDITERCRAEQRLMHDAFHDELTGLANRALFMDHLRMAIERGKSRRSNMYAVLYLDFDRFKVVNDSLGHAQGDNLLKYIARRLENSVRTGDLVARLGGDEFAILLSEFGNPPEALLVAERILSDLKQAFQLGRREIFITASIGIALGKTGRTSADDMLRDADIAMYRAKRNGKAQYQIFDEEMHMSAKRQLQLETDMRHGIARGEFCLHYQPIIRIADGDLVGFEALMRWERGSKGIIPPDVFIPIAEENGMILQLGRWAVEEGCRQLREWQLAYPQSGGLTVSVNLSCQEFLQNDLAEKISATLKKTGLDPRCLKLEITETHLMENSGQTVPIMDRLRALGVEMSLDDFGTGYSSLGYLHSLAVSYLKIDRSFVGRMLDSPTNCEIVATIIKLAQNLKMKVIAEGIETTEQLEKLAELKCELGQGYLFSKPLRPTDARRLIGARKVSARPLQATDIELAQDRPF